MSVNARPGELTQLRPLGFLTGSMCSGLGCGLRGVLIGTGLIRMSPRSQPWLNPAGGNVTFRHGSRKYGDYTYSVSLYARPQPFGGLRWWFICPRSGAKVSKLHMCH